MHPPREVEILRQVAAEIEGGGAGGNRRLFENLIDMLVKL